MYTKQKIMDYIKIMKQQINIIKHSKDPQIIKRAKDEYMRARKLLIISRKTSRVNLASESIEIK